MSDVKLHTRLFEMLSAYLFCSHTRNLACQQQALLARDLHICPVSRILWLNHRWLPRMWTLRSIAEYFTREKHWLRVHRCWGKSDVWICSLHAIIENSSVGLHKRKRCKASENDYLGVQWESPLTSFIITVQSGQIIAAPWYLCSIMQQGRPPEVNPHPAAKAAQYSFL